MVVFVDFRYAKSIGHPEAISNLRTDRCYASMFVTRSVSNLKNGTWLTWIASHTGEEGFGGMHQLVNQAAAPGWINVEGVPLRYDSQGRVLDDHMRPVGMLLCYLPRDSTCLGY
jgi:hypothetical protein